MTNQNSDLYSNLNIVCLECGARLKAPQCGSCGVQVEMVDGIPVFLSNQDKESDLFQRYLKNYETIAEDDLQSDIMNVVYKEAQADRLAGYASRYINGWVLDAGSAKGDFLKRVPHDKKIGIDISLSYLNLLKKKGIKGVVSNAENIPFRDCFDLIVMTDILEHVLNPRLVLESACKALKKNGCLIVRVPYKEDITVYQNNKDIQYEFVHLTSFDENKLESLLEEAGFRLHRFRYDGFSYYRRKRYTGSPLKDFINHTLVPRILYRRKSGDQANEDYAKLPSWLGNWLTNPLEIVAVAAKKHNK